MPRNPPTVSKDLELYHGESLDPLDPAPLFHPSAPQLSV